MAKKNKRPSFKSNNASTFAQPFEFNPDYSTTKADLKRIGGLAGLFFIILFALKFVIK